MQDSLFLILKKSSVERLTCIFRIMKDGGRNKDDECDEVLKHTYIHTSFSDAPRRAFQQPVYNKCKVRWLRVLARPLQAVHNVFFCLRH